MTSFGAETDLEPIIIIIIIIKIPYNTLKLYLFFLIAPFGEEVFLAKHLG